MAIETTFKLTYGGGDRDFYFEDNQGTTREFFVSVMETVRNGGGIVLLEHNQGKTWLAVGSGVPFTIDVFQEQEQLEGSFPGAY